MDVLETKICSKCSKELPANPKYFCKQKRGKYGFRSDCKKCQKQYREDNKDKTAEHIRLYYEEHKGKRDRYFKKYRQDNKIRINQHLKEHKGDMKQYREINKDKISEYNKQYREANKNKVVELQKRWVKINKEKTTEYNQKRRAIKNELSATLTPEQWNSIKVYFNNRCSYCGKELPLAQEHFIALSKGGEYTINNIIPSCKSCNSSKHNNDFFEWYPKYRYYSRKREKFILEYLDYTKDKKQICIPREEHADLLLILNNTPEEYCLYNFNRDKPSGKEINLNK